MSESKTTDKDEIVLLTILSDAYGSGFTFEEWPEISGTAKMIKAKIKDWTIFVIKQYSLPKNQDGEELKRKCDREQEYFSTLNRYYNYIGEVEKFDTKPRNNNPKLNEVVGEVVTLYRGMDLLTYRKEKKPSQADILTVLYHSAIAVGAAHKNNIFHNDINLKNMFIDGPYVKLFNFDYFPQTDTKSLLNGYSTRIKAREAKGFPSYYPPELKYSIKDDTRIPITPGQMDVFCWGMSMYQFLSKKNDRELQEYTEKGLANFEAYSSMLDDIQNMVVEELDSETNACIKKLICRCLQFSPCSRLKMKEVLYYSKSFLSFRGVHLTRLRKTFNSFGDHFFLLLIFAKENKIL